MQHALAAHTRLHATLIRMIKMVTHFSYRIKQQIMLIKKQIGSSSNNTTYKSTL